MAPICTPSWTSGDELGSANAMKVLSLEEELLLGSSFETVVSTLGQPATSASEEMSLTMKMEKRTIRPSMAPLLEMERSVTVLHSDIWTRLI